jgi:predicted nucleic acid-binding protein
MIHLLATPTVTHVPTMYNVKEHAAEKYGMIRAQLEKQGQPISEREYQMYHILQKLPAF